MYTESRAAHGLLILSLAAASVAPLTPRRFDSCHLNWIQFRLARATGSARPRGLAQELRMESATSWSLATYRLNGDERAGILRPDGTLVRTEALRAHAGVAELLRAWEEVAPALRESGPEGGELVEGAELVAPISFPPKLICAGANYASHLAEMGVSFDGRTDLRPFFFLKPATSVIGPGAPIRIPASDDLQVDWEAELGVVIGRRARGLAAGEAPAHVAGYTILNDVSARVAHRRSAPLAPPFEFDWLASKGRDTFCPMGPGVTPAWLIEEPHELAIRLWVNGELKQDGATDDMLVGIWDLIAAASELMTLEPGDVIATGTPSGVGKPRGEFLSPGDEVAIEIPGIGRLSNPVTADAS